MSIFRSFSNAVSTVFDTVGDVGIAAQKSISMATGYIDRRATALNLTDKDEVILGVAQSLQSVKKELDADEELKALFEEASKSFK